MLVIVLVLLVVATGCAVLITEASRNLVPIIGPDAQILTHSTTPAVHATAPVIPAQRTATESAEKTNPVGMNL